MADEIELDLTKLTVEDAETWEELTGLPLEALDEINENGKRPSVKQLRVIIFISQRKKDPSFTYEDAGKVEFAKLTTAKNPTRAGSRKSGSRSSTSGKSRPKNSGR